MSRRILIVTGLYPPNAPTATVRAPKFARFLLDRGHDVRVLSGQNLQFPAAVDPEIPTERITAVPYVRRGRAAPMTEADQPKPGAKASVETAAEPSGIRRLIWQLSYLPDPHITWIDPAVEAALAWDWKPDAIFSTGPPHSSHMAAARLSRAWGVPFVAELRDLWADNIYQNESLIANGVNRWMERRALSKAAALVAVTEGSAEILARRYGKPVVCAANGYDPADFVGLEDVPALDSERLSIVHAGSTYNGGRSPEPLLAALALLKPDPAKLIVHFWGEDSHVPMAMAERTGVAHLVQAHPPIGRGEVLRIERAADILLLLRFATEGEKHVVAGKLYEYVGARRPVLCHGQQEGEAADIIRRTGIGLVSNDPATIADWLSQKLTERASGRLPDLPAGAADGLTRAAQFEKVEAALAELFPR
ncbi:glycosyltransferase [Sphingosinicella sp.]|uniref:glycosyltransferase n=1 Tax=Sphingosinicella sp. TaxID=1917971 RepID=UPI00262975F6|nr:glycosyltransferase [Sphingosinicella sp.]